jgi:folate-binding protein YgfZ
MAISQLDLLSGRAFINYSLRCKFRVSGADAARYLNGQITNDVRKLNETNTLPACVLDAKGRLSAEILVRRLGDNFLLDADRELRESLAARLDRYIVADDVTVQDVTEEYYIFFKEHEVFSGAESDEFVRQSSRLGVSGTEVWTPRSTLTEASIPEMDPLVEELRIVRAFPKWGFELTHDSLPAEAGLDKDYVDFSKGCYLGQEVVSRMKSIGHPARKMIFLVRTDPSGPSLAPGWVLRDSVGKEIGQLTSVARSFYLDTEVALGYVKWSCVATQLQAFSTHAQLPTNDGIMMEIKAPTSLQLPTPI